MSGALDSQAALLVRGVGPRANSAEAVCAAISDLAASGDSEVLPLLAFRFFDPDERIAHGAKEAADRLLASVTDPFALRECARFLWRERSGWIDHWLALTPAKLPALREHSVGALCLATMHDAGRVREAALMLLPSLPGGEELPFVIARLNDWVEAVCVRARHALELRRRPELKSAHVRALPTYARLIGQGRHSHRHVVADVLAWLADGDTCEAVAATFRAPERCLRRVVVEALGDRVLDSAVLAARALASSDEHVRRKVARMVVERGDPRFLDVLLTSKSGWLRSEGITLFAAQSTGDTEAVLQRALLDHHRYVRAAARFALKKRGWKDFSQVYLDALASPNPRLRVTAMGGLGELYDARFASIPRDFIDDPSPRMRVAALWSLVALDRKGAEASLPSFRRDKSSRVRREAHLVTRALGLREPKPPPQSLWREFRETGDLTTGTRAVEAMLHHGSGWTAIPVLLEMRDEAPAELLPLIDKALIRRGWERWHSQATPAVLDDLERLTNVRRAQLPPPVAKVLDDLVKHWRWVLSLHRS